MRHTTILRKRVTTFTLILACLVPTIHSCKYIKAPKPTVESEIKGHQEWGRMRATFRMGRKSDDGRYILAYDQEYNDRIPVYQVYEVARITKKGSGGQDIPSIGVTHGEGFCDTLSFIKGEDIFYTMELQYFNQQDQLMNWQFMVYPEEKELQMLPIHQHFFQITQKSLDGQSDLHPTDLNGKIIDIFAYKRDKDGNIRYDSKKNPRKSGEGDLKRMTRKVYNYQYRDTDPAHLMIGEKYEDVESGEERTVDYVRKERSLDPNMPYDRIGLKGFLNFTYSDIIFLMKIELVHILPGDKYVGPEDNGGFLEFDERLVGWSNTDIILPVPVKVIADYDGDKKKCAQDIALHAYPQDRRPNPDDVEQLLGTMNLDKNYKL